MFCVPESANHSITLTIEPTLMRHLPTRTIIVLASCYGMTGCFGSHSGAGSSDDDLRPLPRLPDAGPTLDAYMPEVDAYIPERDGGLVVDLGSACVPQPATVSCSEMLAPADEPFELPLSIGDFDQCYCGESLACHAEVIRNDRGVPTEIQVQTALCSGGALCDACFPFIEGACSVPALPEGSVVAAINGRRAFNVNVGARSISGRVDYCTTAATDHMSRWPASEFETGETCYHRTVLPGTRFPITVVDDCAPGCGGGVVGPCTVSLDTHPSPPVLRVDATRGVRDIPSEDCPEVCARQEHACIAPALAPGRYEVMVNGLAVQPIEVTADAAPGEEECFFRVDP